MKLVPRLKSISLVWWATLLTGLALTFLIAWGASYQNQLLIKSHTNKLADQAASLIQHRFNYYEYGLRGTRGAIVTVGVDNLTREQFKNYIQSRDIGHEFPGALGFGFIRKVPMQEESAFITEARGDDAPNFAIRTLTPHNDDRFIIQYIYPEGPNRQAVGLDIGSETNRRNAALAAARDSSPKLTAPITLVQANGKAKRGALILLPIYPNNSVFNSPEARQEAVLGWSYAPLIIDDVLANLSSVMDQTFITLTSAEEAEPFYYSSHPEQSDLLQEQVVRDIVVLGQPWKMVLTPYKEIANNTNQWRVSWIAMIGLVITAIVLLIIQKLGLDTPLKGLEKEEILYAKPSITTYLHSYDFHKTWPRLLFLTLLIFVTISFFLVQDRLKQVKSELVSINASILETLQDTTNKFRQDVQFLTKMPPTEALLHLSQEYEREGLSVLQPHKGANSADALSNQQWKERLTDIFKAYMLSTPEVYQVRFIEASSNWQETVKVQRFNNELRTLDGDALQNKRNEPYIIETLKVGVNGVYISDINLNREYGKIEHPERPTWRFAAPIFYADGTPFAIIIINIEVKDILTELLASLPPEIEMYLTDSNDNLLFHPKNTAQTFAFDRGSSYHWQNDFIPVSPWMNLDIADLERFNSPEGYVWSEQSSLALDDQQNGRVIRLHSVRHEFPVQQNIILILAAIAFILVILALVLIALQYWSWLSDRQQDDEEQKKQLQALRDKEMMRFKVLLESVPDAICIADEKSIIRLVNRQAEHMFGYERTELIGKSIDMLIPSAVRNTHHKHVTSYMKHPDNRQMGISKELYAVAHDGTEFPVEIGLSSVQLDEGNLAVASIRDVSDRREIEEKLRHALHEAEKATVSKSAFLANTSHEIRTPLNAIIGLAYLLSEESLTTKQRQLVEKIRISGKSLLTIINDVLDLSKIEANEMKIEARPFELDEFLHEITSVFSVQAEAKQLEFRVTLDSSLPKWIIGDSLRIRQILANLLNNALKFTQQGRISLIAQVQEEDDTLDEHPILVRFTVQDTGIGIAKEAQDNLFKAFSQADESTTRRFGGTGLGLSIVSKLVELLGGKVAIDSQEGQGSTFWVDLPLHVPAANNEVFQEKQDSALFILIAEDNPFEANQLEALSHKLGWRTELVANSTELMASFQDRLAHNMHLPDALIIDWHMPILDSLSTFSSLTKQIGRNRLPAVLMVSTQDINHIKNLDQNNLINHILQKPIEASALFNAINDIVTQHTGNARRVLESTRTDVIQAKWLKGIKVLVVDDSSVNLLVASSILSNNGANVETANNGIDALALLKAAPEHYDIVLMDVQMPGMDGLETTRNIRHSLGLTCLPIIALTAGALVEEKDNALAVGMNDFLSKPIEPSQLIKTVRLHYESYRGPKALFTADENSDSHNITTGDTPQGSTGKLTHGAVSDKVKSDDSWPDIAELDAQKAQQLLMGDKALFFATLEQLLQEHASLINELPAQLDTPDAENTRLQLAAQVHKLRSGAGLVGAESLHVLASDAEISLRNNDPNANQLLEAIAQSLQALQDNSQTALATWRSQKQTALNETKDETSSKLATETLQRLVNLLEAQDLEALDLLEEHAAQLRTTLGHEAFEEFQNSLMALDYKSAQKRLRNFLKNSGIDTI